MRRVEKEYIKLFKKVDLYKLYLEVREMPPKSILEQHEQVQEQEFFRNGGPKVQSLINVFYGLSLKNSYGKWKAGV